MWNSKEFGISSNNYWKEKHHIVFRSQGGLDLEYNLIELDADFHKGKDGPHLNRQTDLKLKRKLQEKYFSLFSKEKYALEEILIIAKPMNNKSKDKLEKRLLKEANYLGEYERERIVRVLMGGRLY